MPNNPLIIKDGRIVENQWQIASDENTDLLQDHILIPYNTWLSHQDELIERVKEGKVGLLLQGEHDIHEHHQGVELFSIIVIEFPVFMDGRGFSVARLLRERYGFTGELRATGGIIRDQLCYLQRCGFNAFDFNEGIDIKAAIHSLNDLSEAYQTAADQSVPLFRRRA